MKFRARLTVATLTLALALVAAQAAAKDQPRESDSGATFEWALEQMKKEVGRWVTDNSAYKSDDEPFDAYGMEWEWAIGEKSLVGRLFPIRNGQDLGAAWEFRLLWQPQKRALWLSQYGPDGTLGEGAITRAGVHTTEALQTFHSPGGVSFVIGHRDELIDGERHMSSFTIDDAGARHPRRSYVWRRAARAARADAAVESQPVSVNHTYESLAWLIGEWQAQFRPHGPGTARPTMSFEWGSASRAFIRMAGATPRDDGGLAPEYEGIIVWHPVEERFVFLGVYHTTAGRMIEDGWISLLESGAARLNMRVHYPPEESASPTEAAASGAGRTTEFRRTLRPDGDDGLRGIFRVRRDDTWVNPHPELLEGEGYEWKRLAGGETVETSG